MGQRFGRVLVMPVVNTYKPIHHKDETINRIQSGVSKAITSIAAQPIVGAKLLPRIALVSGMNTISHGLGHAYQSFFTGRFSAACTVTEAASPDATKLLVVSATAPCTCDFLVL
jgi:hypothetical protein